ncbi:MAG: SWF/SNF helicase family protein [Comamonadaceae bacterium]|nr:SWF/SNF helicase family protein [Comamonadaceae bacterium]
MINAKTAEPSVHLAARKTLENALRGSGSSKLTAVINELHSVWELDPRSKVLIFSQYLGFLDLLEAALRKQGIPSGRLDGKLSLKERVTVLEGLNMGILLRFEGTTNTPVALVQFFSCR